MPLPERDGVIGLAGPLGVGKSSLINSLLALLREKGHRVGTMRSTVEPVHGGLVSATGDE